MADRPGAGEEAPYGFYVYSAPLRVGREELLAAAQAWDEDNRPFPEWKALDTTRSGGTDP